MATLPATITFELSEEDRALLLRVAEALENQRPAIYIPTPTVPNYSPGYPGPYVTC